VFFPGANIKQFLSEGKFFGENFSRNHINFSL